MEPLDRMIVEDPHVLPVKRPDVKRIRDAVKPSNREVDAGGLAWTLVLAPILGGIGYALENVAQLQAVLEMVGVPEGAVMGMLLGLGVTYAAATKVKEALTGGGGS